MLKPLGAGRVNGGGLRVTRSLAYAREFINKPGILECPRGPLGPWPNKWRAHAQTPTTHAYIYIYIYVYVYVYVYVY